MKCFIGLGSNLGERLENLENAARRLKVLSPAVFRNSIVYSTPALVPPGAPPEWRKPFLNSVVEMEWPDSPQELLSALKKIENEMGRETGERWSPRIIDLDILLFGNLVLRQDRLHIPHTGIACRSFVLDPLKQLIPSTHIPDLSTSVLQAARALRGSSPAWMGIINLTPDSFSDGGVYSTPQALLEKIITFEQSNIQMIDLGAESTRPGAVALSFEQEWSRLQPALELLQARYANRIFRPQISVDTRHAEVARRALTYGIDCINDVSGGSPAMYELLNSTSCDYVFMHSLSVPANPNLNISADLDPVYEVKSWVQNKLREFKSQGISEDRLIFDPGIGFGKKASQSLTLLRRIEEFKDLPVRILVGHSRKSFIKHINDGAAADRDAESLGISMRLASQGIDILRVHEAHQHARAYRAYQEIL